MERYYLIAKVNIKNNLLPHIAIALLLCIVSPFLMGVENLNDVQTARVLEVYLSFLGIILCIPLFAPDQDKSIRELLLSKKEPLYTVQWIRILQAVLSIIIMVGIYLLFLKKSGCTFPFLKYFYGAVANCIFLGGLGTLMFGLADNIAVAYMCPMLYYIFNYGGGNKYLGKFYLFSLMGGRITEKHYLLVAGIAMIVMSILYRNRRG